MDEYPVEIDVEIDPDLEPETPEQIEERRVTIRQEMADALGNLGYELDSDDETYELLMWAFDPETARVYEYRVRADLPPGFPQPSSVFSTFEDAAASRDRAKRHRERMTDAATNRDYRDAFEAMGNGWIERHMVGGWERVDES